MIDHLPVNSVVCINPPFTEAYLADVMARLAELKLRFRLRMAVPILEAPWRKKLHSASAQRELYRPNISIYIYIYSCSFSYITISLIFRLISFNLAD